MVARYHPCGAPVEIGRRPYRTRVRLYPDTDEEFELVWYPARDDVPFKRGPNAINSLEWCVDRDEFLRTDVGEVPGAPRTYNPDRVNPLAIGGHVCGSPAEFAGDGVYDPNAPFVVYRPDGLPLCCGALFLSSGGLVISGTADVYTTTIGAGGLVIGGTAAVLIGYLGTGGLVIGGTALVEPSGATIGSGGLVIGGTADVYTATISVGGLVIGGTADVYPEAQPAIGTGGLVIGGTAILFPIAGTCPSGNDCLSAPLSDFDLWCHWTSNDVVRQWRKWAVTPGTTYRFEILFFFSQGTTWKLWQGGSCAGLTLIDGGDGHVQYQTVEFVATAAFVWFEPGIVIVLPSGEGATMLTEV